MRIPSIYNIYIIRASVDALCRDGTEMRRTLKASKLSEYAFSGTLLYSTDVTLAL